MGEASVEAFMESAREHLETARIVEDAGKHFDVVSHSIMCVENAISAIILRLGATPSKRHANHLILQRLMVVVDYESKEEYERVVRFSSELFPQLIRALYPFVSGDRMFIPSEFYKEEHAEAAIDKAEHVYAYAVRTVR